MQRFLRQARVQPLLRLAPLSEAPEGIQTAHPGHAGRRGLAGPVFGKTLDRSCGGGLETNDTLKSVVSSGQLPIFSTYH